VAFLRDGNPLVTQGNLWVRDLVTGQESILVSNTNYIIGYDWDRTGTNLVFDWSCWLWRVSPGTAPAQLPLTTDCYDDAPVVNPADGRLAFHNLNANTAISGLYVTSPNLGSKQNLNVGVFDASWPAWSPDGQRLVFVDGNSSGSAFSPDAGKNLYVVGADGTGLSQISGFADATNGFPHGALWTSDGGGLVGAGTIFGTNGLWIIPLTPELDDCDGPPILLPTSPGDPIDFAGSVVVAPAQTNFVRQPALFIRKAPGAVVVYWSTNFTQFTLESKTSLASTAWLPITAPYPVAGYFYEHWEFQSNLPPTKYFRLIYAPGNLVSNGSFESTNNPAALSYVSLGAGSIAIPGWTTANAEITWDGPLLGINPPLSAFADSDFLDLSGVHDAPPYGGVYQTIPTFVGQNYHVSFALGSDQYYDSYYTSGTFVPPGVTVSVNGTPAFTAFNNFTNQYNYWRVWGFDFAATTSQTTLQFTGIASNRLGYIGLDNVIVTNVVPLGN